MRNAVITDVKSYEQPARRTLRVLVVDDEPDMVLSTMALMRSEGYEARGLHEASDILDNVQRFEPDAIILDIAMPGMTGWEAAAAIRARFRERRLVLIGLSGEYTSGADRSVSRARGFDFYLMKPCDPNVLLALLRWVAIESPYRPPFR